MTREEIEAAMADGPGGFMGCILEDGRLGMVVSLTDDNAMVDVYGKSDARAVTYFVPFASFIGTQLGPIVGLKHAKQVGETETPKPPVPLEDRERQELAALRREHGGWCWKRAEPGTYSLGQHFIATVRDETWEDVRDRTDRTISLRLMLDDSAKLMALREAVANGVVEFRGLELRCEYPQVGHSGRGIEVELNGKCVWGPGYDGYQGIAGERVT